MVPIIPSHWSLNSLLPKTRHWPTSLSIYHTTWENGYLNPVQTTLCCSSLLLTAARWLSWSPWFRSRLYLKWCQGLIDWCRTLRLKPRAFRFGQGAQPGSNDRILSPSGTIRWRSMRWRSDQGDPVQLVMFSFPPDHEGAVWSRHKWRVARWLRPCYLGSGSSLEYPGVLIWPDHWCLPWP